MEIVCPTYSKSPDVPNELVYSLPKRLGCGTVKIESFSSGLHLLHTNLKPIKPIKLVGETSDWNFGVSFNLTGHSEVRAAGNRQIAAKSNTSTHYAYPGRHKIEEDIGVIHKSKIAILFDSKTLLDLANGDEEPFLPFLKGYQSQDPVTGQMGIDVEMKKVLNQIVTCPYRGKTRTLFVEGKAMELLAHRLELIREKGQVSLQKPCMDMLDTERIHYAAELLVRDLMNPPDPAEVAVHIGMSRSKFYRNFKKVFGLSPLDHLRRVRLHTARQLLSKGECNVTEVAFVVGFNNLSYFARAFNAEFGVSPHKII